MKRLGVLLPPPPPPLDGMLVHRRVTPALNSPVPSCTPGRREALCELSVLFICIFFLYRKVQVYVNRPALWPPTTKLLASVDTFQSSQFTENKFKQAQLIAIRFHLSHTNLALIGQEFSKLEGEVETTVCCTTTNNNNSSSSAYLALLQ